MYLERRVRIGRSAVYVLRPTRWMTVDYTKQFA